MTLAVLAVLALGVTVTIILVSSHNTFGAIRRNTDGAALALSATALLTTLNLGMRWLRWHALTRRVSVRIPTKDSVRLYLATVPALATPFYVGELIRPLLLRRRFPGSWAALTVVWVVERIADAAAVLIFLFVARGEWRLAVVSTVLWAAGIYAVAKGCRPTRQSHLATPTAIGIVMGTSLGAWALPVIGLAMTAHILGDGLAMTLAADIFSISTLLGALAGVPLGVAVVGSTELGLLVDSGMARDVASLVVLVFRAATTWYAVALGVLAFIWWRQALVRVVRPSSSDSHFDQIAGEYGVQLGPYLRERLVVRKALAMARHLGGRTQGARGLEIGCGHGWYAEEMARLGFRVTGVDLSAGQVGHARAYLDGTPGVDLGIASATRLPFPDGTFDFAYAINAIHHIHDARARQEALDEVLRVLKPGGTFFLQEINTNNPLFRFYMGYIFPLVRDIDEGNEAWVRSNALPPVEGGKWQPDVDYFTFLPDFAPPSLVRRMASSERWLEKSRIRKWSAHYVARLVKTESHRPTLEEAEPSKV